MPSDRLNTLEKAIAALERREWKGELQSWSKKFLADARKLRLKMKAKA
jgi:hypothetical protein